MGIYDSLYGQQYSDLITPEDQSAAKRKAMLALTSGLLEAGGPSPVPISTGQAIGRGLQAANVGQNQSIENSLKAALLRKQMEPRPVAPPESVQEYQFAKQNGFGGTFQEWIQANKGQASQAQPSADIQAFQLAVSQGFKGTLLDFLEDRAKKTAQPQFVFTNQAGVPVVGNVRTGETTPSATIAQVATNAGTIAGAEAGARGAAENATARAAKAPGLASMEYVAQQMLDQMKQTPQGGPLGIKGQAGRITDFQESRRFNNLKEQLSNELRTAFRIPGEGTLSDKEQAQYGLQLPDVSNDSAINEKIINDLLTRARIRAGGINKIIDSATGSGGNIVNFEDL